MPIYAKDQQITHNVYLNIVNNRFVTNFVYLETMTGKLLAHLSLVGDKFSVKFCEPDIKETIDNGVAAMTLACDEIEMLSDCPDKVFNLLSQEGGHKEYGIEISSYQDDAENFAPGYGIHITQIS